jgi:hypothetical protein
MAAKLAWKLSDLPNWLSEENYRQKVQPHLKDVTISIISMALGVSVPYATDIRAGRRVPHPRHWTNLAVLVGASGDKEN